MKKWKERPGPEQPQGHPPQREAPWRQGSSLKPVPGQNSGAWWAACQGKAGPEKRVTPRGEKKEETL